MGAGHQDSWAFVAGGALAAVALGAAARHWLGQLKNGRAALFALAAVVAFAAGIYGAFYYEGDLDRRDERAKAAVQAAGLEFVETYRDSITVRTKLDSGKTCEATFSMAGWSGKGLPLNAGSGDDPSKGCGVDKLEDIDGSLPFQDAVTDQERALDKIFKIKE